MPPPPLPSPQVLTKRLPLQGIFAVLFSGSDSGRARSHSTALEFASHPFTEWKLAEICPVFKKNDAQDKAMYRPVSILVV